MAELRSISYSNGNGAHAPSATRTGNGDSLRHKGYRKSSYELESVHTSNENGGAKNGKNCVGDDKVPAVVVRNASKHYKKGVPVLQNLNMTVQRGAM